VFFNLKENDLVIVEKSFYCTSGNPNNKYCLKSMDYRKVKKGSILLVIDNNFGSTYKHRYAVFLANNVKIFVKSSMPNDTNLDSCFELLS
jgi:hypothetical protein